MSHGEQAPRSERSPIAATGRVNRRDVLRGVGAGALAIAAGVSPSVASLAARKQAAGITTVPRHESWTASPHTEISFRGVTAEELGVVTVIGTHSGGRSGIVMPHADGNGASFVPDARFEPGEIVTVTAEVPLSGTADGAVRFGVAVPAEITTSPAEVGEAEQAVPTRAFRSRPDLAPPEMSIATPATGTAEGYVFLSTSVNGGQSGAAIVDNDGDYIWFQPTANPLDGHYDVRAQEYQGQPVITFVEGNGPIGYRFGHFVIVDSAYETVVQFQIGNGYTGGDLHEFVLTPEGTAIAGTYHPIVWDLSPAGGTRHGVALDNIIQELEIDTGRVLFEWHSLDDVAIDETIRTVPAEPDTAFDYFHLNSIDRDDNGDYYVSARHTNAIYKIDGATGVLAWRLNGKRSDFEMGEGTPFALQHDARARGNGQLSLFDNASDDFGVDDTVDSRGLLLELDEEAMTATLVREYIHPTGILSVSRANMQMLPNGNVFIGWGAAPVFSEFTEDGELIFDGRYPHGGTSYRAYRFPWVGQPAEPPAVAAEAAADGALTVYASWNGATEVASWRVLGGDSESDLTEIGSGERGGFETEISVEAGVAFIAVEALGASGNILGASETIEVET